jgi:anti-anti-sigma factor
MQIEHENFANCRVFRPIGRLDGLSAGAAESALTNFFNEGGRNLILDLSELVYISSAGLRIVLVAGKQARKAQGALLLAALTPNVREVFEMGGFLGLFRCTDDVPSALEAIAA